MAPRDMHFDSDTETTEPEVLEGCVEAVTFRNAVNGYTVLRLDCDGELITAVGYMPAVSAGEMLRISGRWETHKTYGSQFSVSLCEHSRPVTAEAILKYLSSGSIKGIGPATAARMVDTFGENTLEILDKEPQRLAQIKGISRAKAQKFGAEYARQFGLREVMLTLSGYGVSPDESLRIFKAFGPAAPERIAENPYLLCTPSVGFSFERTDVVAGQLNISSDNRFRVQSGLFHVLRHNVGNGHTCLPRAKLLRAAYNLLGVDPDRVEEELEGLIESADLIGETFGDTLFVFLPSLHTSEQYVARRLTMMLSFPPAPTGAPEEAIDEMERRFSIHYEALQRQAIRAALTKGLLILTGGPGTGKTTTLRGIIGIMEEQHIKIELAAPTGRAAKRMSELTGREARTLHRLLEFEWSDDDTPHFARNDKNPLDCDALIVDEVSMVDAPLFESLLRALRLGCRLILVGDSDQLPAVGAGNMLGDLIASGALPAVRLTEIFRQSVESLIVTNAHRIVTGQAPDLSCRSADFFLLEETVPYRAARLIADLCTSRLPAAYGFSPFDDIQVLCPSRKGETGTHRVNELLQIHLNPADRAKREITINGFVLRQGDKIMQIRNNYDILWTRENGEGGSGVFNGDIGTLVSADGRSGTLCVRFDDRLAVYSELDAKDLEPAYAVTVHKSQGSEYECVVVPVIGVPPLLCYRNLLYTAVTRAKKLLILVGSRQAVLAMVENDRKTLRYTGLRHMLDNLGQEDENPSGLLHLAGQL